MHPLTANLNRNVHPVIHQQRHPKPPRHLEQLPRRLHGRLPVAVLVAVLHDRDAASHGGLDDADEVFGAEDGWGRVGDEVDAVVYF
ncbi:hypothetical protein MKX07_006120 [Trichoderma sp. CBMAI-0711]|nr:hypothetical protein MKX07_006120 [Trichoderma sp. CBMAI-0711]